jgi:hypothetical protein
MLLQLNMQLTCGALGRSRAKVTTAVRPERRVSDFLRAEETLNTTPSGARSVIGGHYCVYPEPSGSQIPTRVYVACGSRRMLLMAFPSGGVGFVANEWPQPANILVVMPAAVTWPTERHHRDIPTFVEPHQVTATEALSTQQQIDRIQERLSLSITQIAAILRITRATVHSWLRGEVDVPRVQAVSRRLTGLLELSETWFAASTRPIGALVNAPLTPHNRSLFDLLHEDMWDQGSIQGAFDALSARISARGSMTDSNGKNVPAPALDAAERSELSRQELRALVRRGGYYGR